MLKKAVATGALYLLASFFLTAVAFAQDGHFDVSVNGAGVFTKQADGNGIAQSATKTVNLFGTFRLKFNRMHSVEFNYGRAKNSQIYNSAFDFRIPATITEYSGAYVFSPIQTARFEPFALIGGAALRFYPGQMLALAGYGTINGVTVPNWVPVNLGAATQTQTALLYGGGVDYRLPILSRFALRLQYRGFFYSAPDFKVSGTGGGVSLFTGARSHMAEPSLGLVFRF